MNTLIASLGQSPAVITETLDYLRDKKNLVFHRLIIISPGKLRLARAINSAGFLKDGKDFSLLDSLPVNKDYPQEVLWSWDIYPGFLNDLEDIRTRDEANEFYKVVTALTWNYHNPDKHIYYAIAGGRKSMSALMVLAAQRLPVKGIYHVLLNDPNLIQNETAMALRDDNTLLDILEKAELDNSYAE